MKAIAFDAASSSSTTGGSPFTWNHTCTGSNLVLIVALINDAGDQVTAVTYNGVAMTQVSKQLAFTSRESYLYILVNPATGTHAVSVTKSSGNMIGAASSYTNASPTSQPDSSNTFTGAASTSYAESLTSVADNDWHVSAAFFFDISTISAGASTSVRVSQNNATVVSTIAIADNNAAIHPAGSNTLNFSAGSNAVWASNGITLRAAPDAITFTADLMPITLTLQSVAFGRSFALSSLSLSLSLVAAQFTPFFYWVNQTKNTSVMTNQTKNSSNWSNQSKNSSSFTNLTKH